MAGRLRAGCDTRRCSAMFVHRAQPELSRDQPAPLVSIVINNYNYARFLSKAIDSALAQTYRNVEVIVVDDGSTHNSVQIIRAYGDRVVPVLKENGDHGSAFNAGFARSQGDPVWFLHADH